MRRLTFVIMIMTSVACLAVTKSTTKTVKGSAMYSMYFPWDLDKVTVSGTIDGKTYTNLELFHGVDFICQRFLGGTLGSNPLPFSYLDESTPLLSGGYIIQFADNYDGQTVTFTFKPEATGELPAPGEAVLTGDPDGRLRSLKTPLYKFDTDEQRFEYCPEGKIISAYEAYISVEDSVWMSHNPYIVPQGSVGIERINAAQVLHRRGIFNLNGQQLAAPRRGLNIINGKKVFIK